MGASLLAGLGVLFASVLLIVPGIIVGAWWGLHQPLIVREQLGVMDSLNESHDRVRGSVAACAFVWIIVWLAWIGGLVAVFWTAPVEGGLPIELALAEVVVVTLLFPLLPLAASAMYDLLPPVPYDEAPDATSAD